MTELAVPLRTRRSAAIDSPGAKALGVVTLGLAAVGGAVSIENGGCTAPFFEPVVASIRCQDCHQSGAVIA